MNDNPYTGSSFDEFLEEEGLYSECSAIAIKRVLARQLEDEMKRLKVERQEDLSTNPFEPKQDKPFSVGHEMKVLSIEDEDESYGIIIKVREGRKTGYVPLADVEVVSEEDPNFWLVREYVVWFANR